MTNLRPLALLATILMTAACGVVSGESVGTSADGIAGGKPDPASRSVGYLVERTSAGTTIEPACTATLVAKQTVVTSAQCVVGVGSSFTAVFDGEKRRVKAVHALPGFDPEDLENGNDLAVLVLDRPIGGVIPAHLGDYTADGETRIVGHGRTSESGDGAPERRSLAASEVNAVGGMLRVPGAGGSVCSADAGAGLLRDGSGGIEIVATLSFSESESDEAAMCATGTVAVLTPLLPHLAFIEGIAKEAGDGVTTQDGPSARPPVTRFDGPLTFDATFYGELNGDLHAALGLDAVALANHWATYGLREARIATAVFDVGYYLAQNADVADQTHGDRGAAVVHFVDYGAREGRRGSIVFDAKYYAAHNPDLAVFNDDYGALARHYMTYGILEGRMASADFDPRFYAANVPAVRDVYGALNYRAATMHFLQHQRDGIRGVL